MSDRLLAFLVPLVHPDAARSWPEVCARLTETVNCLLADHPTESVHVFVGVNRGSPLPPMPSGVSVLELDLPLPSTSIYKSRGQHESDRLRATREDRGKKRLAGLQAARGRGFEYVMNVDADDLVSRKLLHWVRAGRGEPGWYITEGWLYRMGSRLIHKQSNFHKLCGSSHILRTELLHCLCSPEDADNLENIPLLLGEHTKTADLMASYGYQITPLPYRAACYRVGHANNASLRKRHVELWMLRKKPSLLVRSATKTRFLTRKLRREFLVGQ